MPSKTPIALMIASYLPPDIGAGEWVKWAQVKWAV
jgi:hypothetical protein